MDWDHVRVDLRRVLARQHPENAEALLHAFETFTQNADETLSWAKPPQIDAEVLASIDAAVLESFPGRGDRLVRRLHQALRRPLDHRDERVREEKAHLDPALWLEVCPSVTLLRPRDRERQGRFLLEKLQTILGRSRSCDIVLPAQSVSRVHMEFTTHPTGEITVCDLLSRNGTFVFRNSSGGREVMRLAPLSDVRLVDGDCIASGDVVLYFSYPHQTD